MTEEKKITRGRFKGYTVTSAPQDRVTRLAPQIEKILTALGHPEAYVTDESSISDFDPTNEELTRLSAALGVGVERKDYIADVAERMIGGQ